MLKFFERRNDSSDDRELADIRGHRLEAFVGYHDHAEEMSSNTTLAALAKPWNPTRTRMLVTLYPSSRSDARSDIMVHSTPYTIF